MKRLIALVAALLCSFLAFSQEASSGNSTELTVVSRLDVSPILPLSDNGQSGVNLGSSTITTLLDGSLGERFSYSVCNVWASTDTRSLYSNFFRNDSYNWLNWANATLSFGNFDFSLGKDFIQVANYENDLYDFDVYSELAPSIWNTLQVFQWGGKINLNFSEESFISFQAQTSPYNETILSDNLFSYTLFSRSPISNGELMSSISLVEYTPGKFIQIYSAAADLFFNNIELALNLEANKCKEFKDKSNYTIFGKLVYHFSDDTNLFFKGGYEKRETDVDILAYGAEPEFWGIFPSSITKGKGYCYGGIGFESRPFKKVKNLKLHAVSAINNYAEALSFNIGATYYLTFSK